MKCVIPGRFVKLFGRSIHCLSKIGDELYLEATADGLALRTVNGSRSAYGCFLYNESFFHEYIHRSANGAQDHQAEETARFKLSMKSCLGVFKSLNTIEKMVDSCILEYDHKETRLVFKMFCRHGITKTHNLTFQDSDSLQAVFSKDLCSNMIVAQAKLLLDTAANFQTSCEEVTLSCSAEKTKFENYLEDEPDPSKTVHTVMMLDPEEFDNYQIGVDTDITFCLKELRAILAFSEFVNQPVSIQFSNPGKPIVFSLDGDSLYTADFVLATLVDQSNSSEATQDKENITNKQDKSSRNRKYNSNEDVSCKKMKCMDKKSKKRDLGAENGLDETDELNGEELLRRSLSTPPYYEEKADQTKAVSNPGRENRPENSNSEDEFLTNSCPYKELLVGGRGAQPGDKDTRNLQSQEIPLVNKSVTQLQSQRITQSENVSHGVGMPSLGDSLPQDVDQTNDINEFNDDVLPTTPPRKKFRSIFFGNVTESGQKVAMRKLRETILAADTDDED